MSTTTTTAPQTDLNLAPSLVHQRLMQQPPRLAYTGGDVKAWQQKLRRKVRSLTGYDRMPTAAGDKCDLNVRSLWRREHELGTIEKLVFTSEPGADVPAYLCLPRDVKPPYPVFICAQGHSSGMHNSIGVTQEDESVPMDVPGDRDFGLGCLRRGIAALCIEQRAFGEREETNERAKFGDNRCIAASMHAIMLGRTLIAERVYDVERGIDVLAQRGDMDMKRLGLMGNSGGGTVTMFGGALLKRVRFAMPSCYVCNWRESIMSIKHCPDNYVPGLLEVAEAGDVAGLIAPRPMVVVAGQDDRIFPIDAVREAFEQIQRIYRAAGAPENCKLVVGSEGHRFYAEEGWGEMLPMFQRK